MRVPGLPTPKQFAQSVLEMRDEGARMLDEARATGDKKGAAALAGGLRRIDKLIAKHGLRQSAGRSGP